jgi:non-specific protein-tyrosine kinase
MELKRYIDILWRRKLIIILTLLVTMGVVGIGTYLVTPIYQASTILRIAVSAGGSLNYYDFMYTDRLMNTYVEITTARPVVEELMNRLDLSEPPLIKAEIIPNTELIRITVEDVSADRAALEANTLAEILITQSNQLYTGGGKSLTEILGAQLIQSESELDNTRQEYEKLLVQTPPAVEKIDATRQLLQLKQGNYVTLLEQYEQARFREEIQASMITIFERAVVPQTPSKPRLFLNIVLALMVGLMGGVGLAFLIENLDTTLYTIEDIETTTSLPVLAKIPKANKKQINSFQDKFSPIAGAFQNLATNIRFGNHQQPGKALLLVSAEPDQGKSMITSRLAYSLAEFGGNVVVVDCDMRVPNLHNLFHLPNQIGLKDVLEQKVSLKDALQKSPYEGVVVLTSGSLFAHPSQLLGSPQMDKLIESLNQQFDHVLLDSPAMLAVADVTPLVPKVDGLILVVRRAYARRESVQWASNFLAGLNGKFTGLIMNQAKNTDHYGYYQYRRKTGLLRGIFGRISRRKK